MFDDTGGYSDVWREECTMQIPQIWQEIVSETGVHPKSSGLPAILLLNGDSMDI